jgi:hypothetical protein
LTLEFGSGSDRIVEEDESSFTMTVDDAEFKLLPALATVSMMRTVGASSRTIEVLNNTVLRGPASRTITVSIPSGETVVLLPAPDLPPEAILTVGIDVLDDTDEFEPFNFSSSR